eukprot:SAG31_NODE_1314_length_8851_cov_7.233318_6_plen_98_part_00
MELASGSPKNVTCDVKLTKSCGYDCLQVCFDEVSFHACCGMDVSAVLTSLMPTLQDLKRFVELCCDCEKFCELKTFETWIALTLLVITLLLLAKRSV